MTIEYEHRSCPSCGYSTVRNSSHREPAACPVCREDVPLVVRAAHPDDAVTGYDARCWSDARRADNEFGVACSVVEADSCLRMGAKCLLVGFYSGGESLTVRGITRGGRRVEKTAFTHRFSRFRALWLPDHLLGGTSECGTRREMEQRAEFWQARSDQARAEHPLRRSQAEVRA